MPADNPMNAAKVALGARLFADPRLSITGGIPARAATRPSVHSPTAARVRAARPARNSPLNAPTLFNVAYNASLGWRDAGVRTLEQQMRGPLFNEHPPRAGLAGREARSSGAGGGCRDRAGFAAAFPGERAPVTMDNVIRAIAAYERTLFAGGSRVRPLCVRRRTRGAR